MTQKVRWLAALALLLAFGACSVRAEEEDEEVRPSAPSRPVAELLPAPHIVFTAPVTSAAQRPLLFAVPTPFPCPMPVPTGIYGLCPACPSGATCPCPTGECVCPTCACQPLPQEPSQYVVNMKLVKGGDEETAEVTICPRVSIMEGHTAHVLLHGVETPTEQSSLEMQVTVTKQGKGARLEIGVAEAGSRDGGESGARSHTETTEERCNVIFGKPYKLQLKNDGDEKWLEVTVTEVEREERTPRTACAGTCPVMQTTVAAELDGSAMGAVGEIVDCLCDVLSDAATSAFAWALDSNDDEELAPTYLQHPPQYMPPTPPLPVARVVSVEAAPACPACAAASCPQAGSACVQCAAAEVVQSEASHGRRAIEMNEGAMHWTAEADHITVHNDCLYELEGNVRATSRDETGRQSMVLQADRVRVLRKDGCLKIEVDSCGKVQLHD